MVGPSVTSDDDQLPGLPALDGAADDAPLEGVGEDVIDTYEGESAGLDVEAGPHTAMELTDLIDELDPAPATGWDADDTPLGEDPELADGDDENGWAAGAETTELPGWDADLEGREDDEVSYTHDAGEEGVDEPASDPNGDDADHLPPLRAELEADAPMGELELGAEGEIAGPAELDAAPLLGAENVRVAALGPPGEAIIALAPGWAVGDALYRLRPAPTAVELAEADELASVAARGTLVVLGLGLGGALVSRDGGERFERTALRESGGPLAVFIEPTDRPRIWALASGGALQRSEDEGRSFAVAPIPGAVRAVAVHDGGVVALVGARGARLFASSDGGRRWSAQALGDLPAGRAHLAVRGRRVAVVVGSRAIATTLAGEAIEELDRFSGAGPIALVGDVEAPTLIGALYREGEDRALVVRATLAAPRELTLLLDTAAEHANRGLASPHGADADRRAHALVQIGGALLVGTGLGVFEVREDE